MKIDYDNIADNYAKYRTIDSEVIKELLKNGLNGKSKVLEIGCGTGNFIKEIKKITRCSCYGIDPSGAMISQAKKESLDIHFSVDMAEALPFDPDFFDLAFSVDVIHHVENRKKYFEEAVRVLKPNSVLATFTDSEETIRNRMPLAYYFPEIIQHELKRYPTIEKLRELASESEFIEISKVVVETPYKLLEIERYKNKAFSCLQLISDESFAMGIQKMEEDLKEGPIACISRNFLILNKKR